MPAYALIGDIGGTNARLAVCNLETGKISNAQRFLTCDYPSLETVIARFLHETPLKLQYACLAIASPVQGEWISMTNNSWSFSPAAIKKQFAFEQLEIINDFTAVSMSIPSLSEECVIKLGGGEGERDQPIAVYGAGTGLGVSCLIERNGWMVIPGEGGHVDFAATTDEEEIICSIMRSRLGHLSAEKLLSGQGLVNIYQAVVLADKRQPEALSPAEVTARALSNSCKDCSKTLTFFCTAMGHFGGNLALTYGAAGGVYIAGGIVPKIKDFFLNSGFRSAFEDKGRFGKWLKHVPVYLIIHDSPGLTGAAAWLQQLRIPH
ncbi:glucokinase [Erwinia sp. JUb26]|uniref:glucokinase n=1 Tax=Erwinia sp. JUb26 TaxID=2485126 RepID=UPI000F497A72|nr:glucokinase [Erwinia sp. JUb26]ROR15118.1 glucokinase [Erwinia sp. JUb26]